MWLYYFHHFVEKIVQNYSPHSSVDFSREFPDRYSKFISEIINIYEEWIGCVKGPTLSAQPNIEINCPDDYRDDWKIPKSAIVDIGFTLECILLSQKFQEKFKAYWMDGIFRLYFELRSNPVTENYGKALYALLKGKGVGGKKEFHDAVMECFRQVDQIPYRMQYPELFDEFLKT
jgi:hypothetical protein